VRVLGIETAQLVERSRALVLGDRSVLLLQSADEFDQPVPVALDPQCLGDVRRQAALGRLRSDLVKEIFGIVTVTFLLAIQSAILLVLRACHMGSCRHARRPPEVRSMSRSKS
jgi:hypothetical protein